MSDTSAPTEVSQSRAVAVEGRQEIQPAPGASLTPAADSAGPFRPSPTEVRPGAKTRPDVDNTLLLSRFLLGLAVLGGEELMRHVRAIEQELESHPEFVDPGKSPDDDTTIDLFRYLATGLFVRGQRSALKGVRSTFYLSLGTTSWFLGKVNRLTDNRFTRPIRRPIGARLRNMGRKTGTIIQEGKLEEQQGRVLARETVFDIVDDVVDFVSENPEMTDMIRQVIGGQSVGLATVMRDNARQLTTTSDDVLERVVRKLLRRTPRRDLPPSPLEGRPQTMYAPKTHEQWTETHDG